MTTLRIEDIHDIVVDASIHEIEIDIKDIRGSTARIEMSRDDAELLASRLNEALRRI